MKTSNPQNTRVKTADDAVISISVLQSLRRRAEDSRSMKAALPLEIEGSVFRFELQPSGGKP